MNYTIDLAKLRKAAGLTQAQIGEAFGYTDRHVRNWESGRIGIPEKLIPKLLAFLGNTKEQS